MSKAMALIDQGQIQEAILCLEAEVQKNKENATAWRMLG
jgi:predicted Zn-dependent protease